MAVQYEVSAVTQSFKLILTIAIVQILTYFKQHIIFNSIKGINDPTFLELLHNCHSVFTVHASL